MNYAPGWATIGNTAGIFTAVHTVTAADTGTFEFRWGVNANNVGMHAMICGGTFGYRNGTVTSFSVLVCTLPPISILKNSTVLIYYTTVGAIQATNKTLNPNDYVLALTSGFQLESRYKVFGNDISEGFTLTWTGTATPPSSRISRIEILGAT